MLEKYKAKRNFSETPEPDQPGQASNGSLRFVVQKHSARNLHYDFRLEADGVLKSWAVPKGPSLDPKVRRLAVAVEDHPISYIGFEGVIPKGQYGGGEVIVWDTGTYAPMGEYPTLRDAEKAVLEGLQEGELSVMLYGQKLAGEWTLVHTREKQWLLIKKDDFAANDSDVTLQEASVLTGRTNKSLEEPSAMPRTIRPMLATEAREPFTDDNWTFELKLDGIRAIAFLENGKARIASRTGNDLTSKFPTIVRELESSSMKNLILDGEIVLLDEQGRPSFQKLMNRGQVVSGDDGAQFFVFDLLFRDGEDYKQYPQKRRREALEALNLHASKLRVLDSFPTDGVLLYDQVVQLGLEGIVGKRLDSKYREGARNGDWIKVKQYHSEDFLICGFTKGEGSRQESFGALLLGQQKDGSLLYCGNVGSGFNDKDLVEVCKILRSLEASKSPFTKPAAMPARDLARVQWVRPELAAEVRYQNWTKDHRLRLPVFMRLRPDLETKMTASSNNSESDQLLEQILKAPSDFKVNVNGYEIALTNMDKPLWPSHEEMPAVCKRDLIAYYAGISSLLLPQIKDRPISFVRYPNGISGPSFFQRHWDKNPPEYVETVNVWSEHNGKAAAYVMCNNLATLVWLGQLAALEIHSWYSRVVASPDAEELGTDFKTESSLDSSVLNYPDFVVFDLDPNIRSGKEAPGKDPDLTRSGWDRTVAVALKLQEVLGQIGLGSFVKTSGKTGLHVFVPINRIYTYEQTRSMAESIGRHMVEKMPADVTMEWSLKKRPNKIFFDHNQNVRGKTLAAIYSPRPVAGAPVSFPVAWSDLPSTFPTDYSVANAAAMATKQESLWAEILSHRQGLTQIFSTL